MDHKRQISTMNHQLQAGCCAAATLGIIILILALITQITSGNEKPGAVRTVNIICQDEESYASKWGCPGSTRRLDSEFDGANSYVDSIATSSDRCSTLSTICTRSSALPSNPCLCSGASQEASATSTSTSTSSSAVTTNVNLPVAATGNMNISVSPGSGARRLANTSSGLAAAFAADPNANAAVKAAIARVAGASSSAITTVILAPLTTRRLSLLYAQPENRRLQSDEVCEALYNIIDPTSPGDVGTYVANLQSKSNQEVAKEIQTDIDSYTNSYSVQVLNFSAEEGTVSWTTVEPGETTTTTTLAPGETTTTTTTSSTTTASGETTTTTTSATGETTTTTSTTTTTLAPGETTTTTTSATGETTTTTTTTTIASGETTTTTTSAPGETTTSTTTTTTTLAPGETTTITTLAPGETTTTTTTTTIASGETTTTTTLAPGETTTSTTTTTTTLAPGETTTTTTLAPGETTTTTTTTTIASGETTTTTTLAPGETTTSTTTTTTTLAPGETTTTTTLAPGETTTSTTTTTTTLAPGETTTTTTLAPGETTTTSTSAPGETTTTTTTTTTNSSEVSGRRLREERLGQNQQGAGRLDLGFMQQSRRLTATYRGAYCETWDSGDTEDWCFVESYSLCGQRKTHNGSPQLTSSTGPCTSEVDSRSTYLLEGYDELSAVIFWAWFAGIALLLAACCAEWLRQQPSKDTEVRMRSMSTQYASASDNKAMYPRDGVGDSLDNRFQIAQQQVMEKLRESTPEDTKMRIYGLYRQAKEGDVTGTRPGMLNRRERAKYDAWAQNRGMSREAAMEAYIRQSQML